MINIRSGEKDLYEELIKKFKKLPDIQKPAPTIFEISGYPHYEDVISNVLAFFLRKDQGHDFAPLFVEALLEASGKTTDEYGSSDYEVVKVLREETTFKNNRIDLIIETESLCIAIENKIYHHLNNDLDDYESYIQNNYEAQDKIFLILSLRDLEPSKKIQNTAFVLVTYETFFDALEARIGKCVPNTDTKYLVYISDLIKTLRRMNKKTMLSEEFLNFLSNNKTEIESLHQRAFEDFKNEIRSKASEVNNLLDRSNFEYTKFHLTKSNKLEFVQGYRRNISLDSGKTELGIKFRLSPKNYALEVWSEDSTNGNRLNKLLQDKLKESYPAINNHPENSSGKVLKEFIYGENTEEIADEIKSLMNLLKSI